MPDTRELKRRAAESAVALVRSGMVLGLGTGSTAAFAVEAIGRRLAAGELTDLRGVPTSDATARLAESVGIPLTTLEEHPAIDLTIDGADQVDGNGDLIKGGGGALLREKIVAVASSAYAIIVDEGKLVDTLGDGYPLPVEVVKFGWTTCYATIRALGGEPVLRERDGMPFVSDEGHYIVDCTFQGGIDDSHAVHAALLAHPVVVETGLFLGLGPEVIVGRP